MGIAGEMERWQMNVEKYGGGMINTVPLSVARRFELEE